MNADAILRITEAMRDRLKAALQSFSMPDKVFVGPLDDADATNAALILFLYRVVPNPSLRNTEHEVPSATPPPVVNVFRGSIPLDLYYLVTVGTTPNDSEETPLRSLGIAMQALQAEPDFTGAKLNHETVHVTLDPLTTEEASRIWALFPTANYRTSIAYLATPVWIDPSKPETPAVHVIQDQLRAAQKPTEAVQ